MSQYKTQFRRWDKKDWEDSKSFDSLDKASTKVYFVMTAYPKDYAEGRVIDMNEDVYPFPPGKHKVVKYHKENFNYGD